jgi:hypothetical protein
MMLGLILQCEVTNNIAQKQQVQQTSLRVEGTGRIRMQRRRQTCFPLGRVPVPHIEFICQ